MKTILDEIVQNKRLEIKELKKIKSFKDFENEMYFNREVNSISKAITQSDFGIIAEFKRKSPSAGNILSDFTLDEVLEKYKEFNTCAYSCLTDEKYFGCTQNDLLEMRKLTQLPILRKEFIVDEFQIFESKALGADAILLISEVLEKEELEHFTTIAQALSLEVIAECNSISTFHKIPEDVNVIGINNRNLANQKTDIATSIELFQFIKSDKITISESGIKSANAISQLKDIGFNGVLIGEYFLKSLEKNLEKQ